MPSALSSLLESLADLWHDTPLGERAGLFAAAAAVFIFLAVSEEQTESRFVLFVFAAVASLIIAAMVMFGILD